MKTISILGGGWLGRAVAKALQEQGVFVKISTTTKRKLGEFRNELLHPYFLNFNPEIEGEASDFFHSEALILCIPPRIKDHGGQFYLKQIQEIVRHARQGKVEKVIFISSTSVYIDCNAVVTEIDSNPESVLAKAEQLFLNDSKFKTTIVRFAGLVGPGRHPGRFLSGKVTKGGNNPVNVIHLLDCIRIIEAILKSECWNMIFNACASDHPSRIDFYNKATAELELPLPFFSDEQNLPFKIVSSEKLRVDLNFSFIFDDPMKMTF